MAPSNKSPYRIGPEGTARYPWVNKADTKFNDDGIFKTDVIVAGEAAKKEVERLDALAAAALEEETEGLSPAERKKWSVYVPYTVEEDEDGNPTGRVIFHYKQNAIIRVEGVAKPIKIAIFNAADEPKEIPVWSGDTIRVMAKTRNIKLASQKKAGVRLDFLKVQVLKKADRDAAQGGFGSVEGGYMGEEADSFSAQNEAPADTSGDY